MGFLVADNTTNEEQAEKVIEDACKAFDYLSDWANDRYMDGADGLAVSGALAFMFSYLVKVSDIDRDTHRKAIDKLCGFMAARITIKGEGDEDTSEV